MYGVRLSYFASDLERLANAHPPAREAVAELRDRAAPPPSGPIELETFRDWACLNRVLGEEQRTLVWYDALPATNRAGLGLLLEHDIIPLLIEAERWADAGSLYDEPLTTIERAGEILAFTTKHQPGAELVEQTREYFRKTAATLVRALCAAGRVQEVDSVTDRAREIDTSNERRTRSRALA